jgi:hypothetical protein
MARRSRIQNRVRGDVHKPYGEEIAFLLSLVVSTVLGLTIAVLALVEFFEALPAGLASMFLMSVLALVAVPVYALLEKALALPQTSRGLTPVVRPLDR